ncbi:MAG: hypothetical protein AAFX87_14115 [Bacteroidota bacterium]
MINRPSIAIVPFKNLSGNSSLDAFLEGLVLDMHTDLSRFRDLSVLSTYSTELLSDKSQEEIFQTLTADFMVFCTFRENKDKIRFNLQVTKREDASIVFAGRHEETLKDLYGKYDEICQQLVNVIQQQINIQLHAEAALKRPPQMMVYDYYQRGMTALRLGTREGDSEAREHFNKALAIAPEYANAYTGIALSYFNEWSCLFWDDWYTHLNLAKEMALKALNLDENNYRALMILSRTYLFNQEFEKSEQFLEKALKLNPNDADLLAQGATTYAFLGDMNKAIESYQKAIFLNPLHENWYYTYGVFIYFELGEYDSCKALATKMDESSQWIDIDVFVGAAHYQLGEEQQAIEAWHRFEKTYRNRINPNSSASEIVKWCQDVNPYRNKTAYHVFLDFISQNQGLVITSEVTANDTASLHQNGDQWKIVFQNTTISVPGSKGMTDIARLLDCPDQEVHCTSLIGSGFKESAIESIDEQAKTEYKRRLEALEAEMREAETIHHYGRLETLRAEFEQLTDQLTSSLGLHGAIRSTHSTDEKARTAVTWRIRNAIKKVGKIHPPLGKHWQASIKTGSYCKYSPETSISWDVSY